jgi:hypothetical protein
VHLALQIEEVGRRDAADRVLRGRAIDAVQLLAVRIRERLEQDGVEDTEHRGVRANAETEGDDRQDGESGGADQLPEGET